MKQEITPWSIYENMYKKQTIDSQQPKRQKLPSYKRAKKKQIPRLPVPKSPRMLSPLPIKSARTPLTEMIETQKQQLSEQITKLSILRILQTYLLVNEDSVIKRVPTINKQPLTHSKSGKKLESQRKKSEQKQKQVNSNIPRFPKLKIQIIQDQKTNKKFDDTNIHEKWQMMKQQKKKFIQLSALITPSSAQI